MYGVGSSQVIARDASLLFSSTFKPPDGGELTKNREFTNSSDLYHHQQQQQQQQQQSAGLMRYRSAPSSFFANLINGGGGDNECDEFLNPQLPNSESDAIIARFMSTSAGDLDSTDLQFPAVVKHETGQMVYQTQLPNRGMGSADGSFSNGGRAMESPVHVKTSSGGMGSSLMRQSSSPADFFSSLTVENGVAAMRDVGNFKVGNEKNLSTGRLPGHRSFSSGPSSRSRFMPQIAENGSEHMGAGSPENERLGNDNVNNRNYVPSFPSDSWNDSSFTSLKRNREDDNDDVKLFSSFNSLETQNGDGRNHRPGLIHHLSLPKTSAEMAAVEKYLQFQQDQIPCKIRAKRGFATHPRSIAERMRRTRISERMRKLQELFPNMDKQTNTAEMLDLAVEYIKDLQTRVKTLTDMRAKCTCLSKPKQSNPTT